MAIQPPPWLCTKQRYVHMSILIQGPKQPGVDMHLYLGLLKEELATLWQTPARTWDAYKRDYFPLRAAVLMTVQDYPGYANVSWQVNNGFMPSVLATSTMLLGSSAANPYTALNALHWLPSTRCLSLRSSPSSGFFLSACQRIRALLPLDL